MFDIFKKKVDIATYYQAVFSTHEGKRVLNDLVEKSGILNSSFDPNPQVLSFNSGKKELVILILRELNVDIQELIKRQEEQKALDQKYIS